MSAPTPFIRSPVSVLMPVTRPTIRRISETSIATASTLTPVLTGRLAKFERMISLFKKGLQVGTRR